MKRDREAGKRRRLAAPFGRERRGGMAVVWRARPAERKPATRAAPEAGESYVGETCLRELEAFPESASDAVRIVARYASLRVLVRASEGVLYGPALEAERRAVGSYLAVLPDSDAERDALWAAIVCAGPCAPRGYADALHTAGVAAGAAGHSTGGDRLAHLAYETSLRYGWWSEAARSARALEKSAASCGRDRDARRWRRRARALERIAE